MAVVFKAECELCSDVYYISRNEKGLLTFVLARIRMPHPIHLARDREKNDKASLGL